MCKKVLILIGCFALFMVQITFLGSEVAHASQPSSLVKDYDFENYTLGTDLIAAGEFGYMWNTSTKAEIVQDPLDSTNKCCRVMFTQAGVAGTYVQLPDGMDGKVVFDYKFMVPTLDAYNPDVLFVKNQSDQDIIQIGLNATDMVFDATHTTPYSAGIWNSLRVIADVGTHSFDAYLNSQLVATGVLFKSGTTTTSIAKFRVRIQSSQINKPSYLDELHIYKQAEENILVHPAVSSLNPAANITTTSQISLSTITDPSLNPQIYYTTDGTIPTQSSTRYTAPISNIHDGTVIKTLVVAGSYSSIVKSYGPYTLLKPYMMDFENYSDGQDITGSFAGAADGATAIIYHDSENNNNYLKVMKTGSSASVYLQKTFPQSWKPDGGTMTFEYKVMSPTIPYGSNTARQIYKCFIYDAAGAQKQLIVSFVQGSADGQTSSKIQLLLDGTNIPLASGTDNYYANCFKKFKFVVTSPNKLSLYVTDYDASGRPETEQTALDNYSLSYTFRELYRVDMMLSQNYFNQYFYVDDVIVYNAQCPIVEPVTASITHGEVEARIPVVALSGATAGSNIYYTLDGSMPTASSNLYNPAKPISFTANNVFIKAIAEKGGILSTVKTYGPYTLKTFSGLACTKNVFKKGGQELSSPVSLQKGDVLTNEITMYKPEPGSKNVVVILGLYHGNELEEVDVYPLTLNKEYETETVEHIVQKDQTEYVMKSYVWTDMDFLHPIGRANEIQ